MHIVHVHGSKEQAYQAEGSPRPTECRHCGSQNSQIGHGYYMRKPKGMESARRVAIKRWKCKTCQKSMASLPDFLLSYRHYVVEKIGKVLEARYEHGYSWTGVNGSCSAAGIPALRTMQRWCKSFGGEASRWLGKVQESLAQVDSHSSWLDPQGEAPRARSAAEALLSASEHLLAWGKTQWVETLGYGRKERLRFVWLWGANQGLGRLV